MRSHVFPPLAVKNNNIWSGIDINYGRALIEAAGCQLKITEAPWARGIELLKAGKLDLMVNVTKNPEREKYFHFIGPQRIENIVLVSKKSSLSQIYSWKQLETLDAVIMRQRGSYFGEKFENTLNNNTKLKEKLKELASNENRIKLINTRRIDAFLVDELFINAQPKKTRDLLEIHPLIISSNPVYYAFSKASVDENQIKKLQAAFEQLSQSPEFLQISQVKD